MNRTRRRTFAALGLCAGALVAIVVLALALSANVVYFRTVSEAVDTRAGAGSDRFRMAGAVVAGSIAETATGVRFRLTDGTATVPVEHRGDPPDLFANGAPVVCEGRWDRAGTFLSDRILIKHGSEYRPPRVRQTAKRAA